jgi:hypothetical protein
MEGGDREAASRLIPLGYAELRRLVARAQLHVEMSRKALV